jgi:hypothetical protein
MSGLEIKTEPGWRQFTGCNGGYDRKDFSASSGQGKDGGIFPNARQFV